MGLAPATLSARMRELRTAAVVRAHVGFAPAAVSARAWARLRLYMHKMLSLRKKFFDVYSVLHAPMNLQFFDYTQRQKVCTEFLIFLYLSGTKPEMNQTYQVWLPRTFFFS